VLVKQAEYARNDTFRTVYEDSVMVVFAKK